MAEPYLTDLKDLADQWMRVDERVGTLECRHFFAGAAVYRAGSLIASLTPVGLAFKVPAAIHDDLIASGLAVPLRYFPSGPIKRNYVLFPTSTALDAPAASRLILGEVIGSAGGEEAVPAEPFGFDSMPHLETERLVLREIHPTRDLTALFELFSDPEVAHFTDTGPFQSIDDATEVMDWFIGIFAQELGMRWGLALKSDEGSMVGTTGFNRWSRGNSTAEIGYDLARNQWGKGLMTEALEAMLSFGFTRMALNRTEADVTSGNDASVRVLEKLGFVYEGTLRQRGYWKGGYHDLQYFGLLREDWKA